MPEKPLILWTFTLVSDPYFLAMHLSALKVRKTKQEPWSAVGISWEKNTDHLFNCFTTIDSIWILLKFNLCIFVLFTLAKFDRIVSCWTNSNDYLIIRRAKNRSQSFEALTINPEKQTKGKGGMRQWRISWAFSRNGTMTEKEKKFFTHLGNIFH